MNRCQVCDKTDEDDLQANIKSYEFKDMGACQEFTGTEMRCLECQANITGNLEDLSINDENELDLSNEYLVPEAIVQDDHWVEAPVPEVPEQ